MLTCELVDCQVDVRLATIRVREKMLVDMPGLLGGDVRRRSSGTRGGAQLLSHSSQ